MHPDLVVARVRSLRSRVSRGNAGVVVGESRQSRQRGGGKMRETNKGVDRDQPGAGGERRRGEDGNGQLRLESNASWRAASVRLEILKVALVPQVLVPLYLSLGLMMSSRCRPSLVRGLSTISAMTRALPNVTPDTQT